MDFIKNNKKINELVQKGRTDNAILHLKKLILKKKNIALNSLILSEIYIIEKNLLKAIEVLEDLKPQINFIKQELQFKIFDMLGDHYYKNEDHKKSFLNYQRALKIKQDDNSILSKISHIYIDINSLKKAEQILEYLHKKEPDNLYYKCLLAFFYIQSHQYEKSQHALNNILKNNKDYSLANYYLGYQYYNMEEYSRAIEYFESAKKEIFLRLKCNYYLGKIEEKKLNFRHAIEFLNKAKKSIDFENELTLDLHYSLAFCYENIKEYHNALEELRTIHNINPEYRDIKEKLISKNYKNSSKSYLLDYNIYSTDNFYKFALKLLHKFNLKPLGYKIIEDDLLIFETKVDKNNIIYEFFKDFINYSKREKILIIFLRITPVSENVMENILKNIDFKFNKGIFLTSSDISPLAIEYANEQKIKVISPTFLNEIIKESHEKSY